MGILIGAQRPRQAITTINSMKMQLTHATLFLAVLLIGASSALPVDTEEYPEESLMDEADSLLQSPPREDTFFEEDTFEPHQVLWENEDSYASQMKKAKISRHQSAVQSPEAMAREFHVSVMDMEKIYGQKKKRAPMHDKHAPRVPSHKVGVAKAAANMKKKEEAAPEAAPLKSPTHGHAFKWPRSAFGKGEAKKKKAEAAPEAAPVKKAAPVVESPPHGHAFKWPRSAFAQTHKVAAKPKKVAAKHGGPTGKVKAAYLKRLQHQRAEKSKRTKKAKAPWGGGTFFHPKGKALKRAKKLEKKLAAKTTHNSIMDSANAGALPIRKKAAKHIVVPKEKRAGMLDHGTDGFHGDAPKKHAKKKAVVTKNYSWDFLEDGNSMQKKEAKSVDKMVSAKALSHDQEEIDKVMALADSLSNDEKALSSEVVTEKAIQKNYNTVDDEMVDFLLA